MGPGARLARGAADAAESNQQPSGVKKKKRLLRPEECGSDLQGPNGSNLPRSSGAGQPPINYLDSVACSMVEVDACAPYRRRLVIAGIGRER